VIEAELKARVRAPESVLTALEARAAGRAEVYQDTYYDDPSRTLAARDAELRVRTVHGPEDTRTVLTYKGARVDDASGSKPEHETHVTDADAVHGILHGLGYVPVIAFEKRCRNYRLTARGRPMLATLVRVPELDGVFLELETQTTEHDVPDALDDVRAVLLELGIEEHDLTTETYTEAVAARRGA
jgi:adenylate cyclase class 2